MHEETNICIHKVKCEVIVCSTPYLRISLSLSWGKSLEALGFSV